MTDSPTDAGDTLAGLALHRADDAAALARRLAARVAGALRTALDERGAASLVVSGGTTPVPMFEALSREALDWARVGVTLADERAVPLDDEASNEAMVRTHLLTNEAAAARMTGLHRADMDLAHVAASLDALARPFDVLLLGMGTDGHTASLFPDAPELEAAMSTDEVLMAMHPPSTDNVRITLTRAALLRSRTMILHVTGEAKRDVLASAMADWRAHGDLPRVAPIARVLGRATQAGAGPDAGLWWAP